MTALHRLWGWQRSDLPGAPGRFHHPGWVHQGTEPGRCAQCGHRPVRVARKHYETTQGTYHYWAIGCDGCRSVDGITDLAATRRRELHRWADSRPFDCTECDTQAGPNTAFLCIANSRKLGERCLALIDPTGRPFRPVSDRPGGAVTDEEAWLPERGRPMRPGDFIDALLGPARPLAYQPEDVQLPDDGWRATAGSDHQQLDWLVRAADQPIGFLARRGSGIALQELIDDPPDNSLAVVEPSDLTFIKTHSINGSLQTRARFTLGGVEHDFPVTDDDVEHRVKAQPHRETDLAQLGFDGSIRTFLTISLGEPLGGTCYKIVAGVMPVLAS